MIVQRANNCGGILLRVCLLSSLALLLASDQVVVGAAGQEPEPHEVLPAQPPPLPAIWESLRAGHWVQGTNLPWDNYGTDYGSNAWGYRGLASQGPSGWRRENRGNDAAAKRLLWAQRNASNHCLGVKVELRGSLSSALVFARIDEAADKQIDQTIDLTGQTVEADIYLPSGIEGPSNAPSSAMLFFQDNDWTWAQTNWMNIERTNEWIRLSILPDNLTSQFSGFDAARVRTVGVKVGKNTSAANFTYEGNFYIDNVSTTSTSGINSGFDSPDTRIEREMKDIAGLGVNTVRVWLFADGRAGLKFDNTGFVVGLDEEFLADFDELVRLARSAKIYLIPVLFDFLMAAEGKTVDGVLVFGRADLINDPAKRRSLLDKAVSVIFEKLAAINEIAIIEMMNEPEWLLRDISIPSGKRPPEIREGGVIDLATMRAFFSEIVELSREKGLAQKHLFTIGSGSPRWVELWKDLSLDIAEFHLWNGSGQIDDGLRLDFRSPMTCIPTFVGEFSTLPGSLQDTCEMLRNAHVHGYSGVLPWAFRAKDAASVPLLGESARNCLSRSIVISQVYGGGGNPGASYKNDFIELFNRGATAVDVTGWTVQYAPAGRSSWVSTQLSGSIPPGQYYLVRGGSGGGGSVELPASDAIGPVNLSATDGKAALVSGTALLSDLCPPRAVVVDFVGYGNANCAEVSPAPILTNATANLRATGGCMDSDSNRSDFYAGLPNPRNSASTNTSCRSLPPPVTLVAPSRNNSTPLPIFAWNATATATWYQVWVNDSGASPKISRWYTAGQAGCPSGTGICFVTPDVALAEGAARWWVQTWNSPGYGPWSQPIDFTVSPICEGPGKVTLASPTDTSNEAPTYTWNADPDAAWYYLWVNNPDPKVQQWYTAAQAECVTGSGTCSVTPSSQLAAGPATWWIQTWNPCNAGSFGPWSDGTPFIIATSSGPPGKAMLLAPEERISTAMPTYTWNTVPTASWYYLWVNDGIGTRIQQWYTAQQAGCELESGTCSVTPSVSLTSGGGRWWVQTWNPFGYGPWSDSKDFKIELGCIVP